MPTLYLIPQKEALQAVLDGSEALVLRPSKWLFQRLCMKRHDRVVIRTNNYRWSERTITGKFISWHLVRYNKVIDGVKANKGDVVVRFKKDPQEAKGRAYLPANRL